MILACGSQYSSRNHRSRYEHQHVVDCRHITSGDFQRMKNIAQNRKFGKNKHLIV